MSTASVIAVSPDTTVVTLNTSPPIITVNLDTTVVTTTLNTPPPVIIEAGKQGPPGPQGYSIENVEIVGNQLKITLDNATVINAGTLFAASDLTVSTALAGTNSLTYSNGVFTFTPTDLSSYVTNSVLTTTLANYETTADLIATLDAYATKTYVADQNYLTSITGSQVTTALGFTPYNASNPAGYITGITSSSVTTALGYTPPQPTGAGASGTWDISITGTAALANSGVTAGTYGDATNIPQITVDEKGRITSVTTVVLSVAPVSPTFTYINSLLTSIAYGSGESKIFTYTNSLLTQLDFIKGSTTVRKTFNYTDGVLTSITQVTL